VSSDRLSQQIAFIIEIDKLKSILRQTLITDGSRRENSAEHSWHLAVMAPLLAEYAPEPVNVERAIRMLLVHDIVEIDAGDTFAYDTHGNESKAERELQAADRIFGLLPENQQREYRALWEEFEIRETADSRFANALDRLQPLLNNYRTQGGTWRIHKLNRTQVIKRMEPVREFLPTVYPIVEEYLSDACDRGWLEE
jgi:putative hydrolases of HD superfamily